MALSGIEMLVSAEVRWFWRGQRRQPVHDWFFKSGLPPGGGQSRIDRYAPQRGKAEISLKRRGNKPEFEVKGLVQREEFRSSNRSHRISKYGASGPVQFQGLDLRDEVAVTKTRWLRKFDTSKYVRSEIPLDASERPKADYLLPRPRMQCRIDRGANSRPLRSVVDTRLRSIRRP